MRGSRSTLKQAERKPIFDVRLSWKGWKEDVVRKCLFDCVDSVMTLKKKSLWCSYLGVNVTGFDARVDLKSKGFEVDFCIK